MPVSIRLQETDDERDVVHRAVQAVAEGKLVAFPTDTVYCVVASALNEAAVARLRALKSCDARQTPILLVKSSDDALDYIPDFPPLAERLTRRTWPGPLTLFLEDRHADSLLHRLPESVRASLLESTLLGMRAPAHRLVDAVLRLSAGPMISVAIAREGKEPTTAEELIAAEEKVDLVIDDGPSAHGQPASIVRLQNGKCVVQMEGVYNAEQIQRLAGIVVLFVCTGNTCRSPMAEVLMKKRIADRLGCTEEELHARGVTVLSAGIAAGAGGRCAAEAEQAMSERQLDLSGHASQPVSDRLIRHCDLILTMTRGHREALVAHWPEAAARTKLLRSDSRDIGDPVGGPLDLYRRCAEQIDMQLDHWLEQLDLESLP